MTAGIPSSLEAIDVSRSASGANSRMRSGKIPPPKR
jgi:hypothetical protein